MSLPIVAICGRPNVGKSTLFNALARSRISIVEPTSGVTRDRVQKVVEIDNRYFELVDTGGIGIVDEQDLSEQIYQQVLVALRKAELILFMVDIKDGVTPLDVHVADLVRRENKKILLLANKTDFPELAMDAQQFWKLGCDEPMCISAKTGQGINALREKIYNSIPDAGEAPDESDLKIAVVGKPNSGKSTFINALAEEERVIVSQIPGTTRDSIDVKFTKDGRSITAIDTAGLKRSKNVKGSIDFYSQKRAERAIRLCDVALLLIDATVTIDRIDSEIASYIREFNKPGVIVINKWDLVPEHVSMEKYVAYINATLPVLGYAPISFITASTGKNVHSTINLVRSLFKQANRRTGTGELNRHLKKIVARRSPPVIQGKQVKFYYATQVAVNPPTIVIFVNKSKLITKGYQRYLFNALQKKLRFEEVPVRIEFREKGKEGAGREKEILASDEK